LVTHVGSTRHSCEISEGIYIRSPPSARWRTVKYHPLGPTTLHHYKHSKSTTEKTS
jgi:hypothetical protein